MIIELTKQPGKRLPQIRIWGGTVRELEKRTIKTMTPLIVKQARSEAVRRGWETRRRKLSEVPAAETTAADHFDEYTNQQHGG